jgi:hypothetical protein
MMDGRYALDTRTSRDCIHGTYGRRGKAVGLRDTGGFAVFQTAGGLAVGANPKITKK